MIDWARVHELRDEVGAEDFDEVVELFLGEVAEVLGRLPDCDASALRGELHFLKGSALNIGLAAFADACAQGEAAVAAGGAVDISVLSSGFDRAAAELRGGL